MKELRQECGDLTAKERNRTATHEEKERIEARGAEIDCLNYQLPIGRVWRENEKNGMNSKPKENISVKRENKKYEREMLFSVEKSSSKILPISLPFEDTNQFEGKRRYFQHLV